jgi:predicted HicB family RNase H-like nuclease
MPKYYNEESNKASLRYKKKNTEQINISFQSGQGIREMFREQAEKNGMSVNKYVIELVRADAEGRLIYKPEPKKDDKS